MMVFVGKAPASVHPWTAQYPNLGVLTSPRRLGDGMRAYRIGLTWAADNDCFNGGLDRFAYELLLAEAAEYGAEWVTMPDVVADADATRALASLWIDRVPRPAYVLQDGETSRGVPWNNIAAVFVGGSTKWKLSDDAHCLVLEAQRRGLWVHMGRVNTRRRIRLAAAWGVTSIDGTNVVKWTDRHLPWVARHAQQKPQGLLFGSDAPHDECRYDGGTPIAGSGDGLSPVRPPSPGSASRSVHGVGRTGERTDR